MVGNSILRGSREAGSARPAITVALCFQIRTCIKTIKGMGDVSKGVADWLLPAARY